MNETITKHSETEIKISTPKEEVISVVDLKLNYTKAMDSLNEFENWVLIEREARQKTIDDALERIDKAGQVGVETK